MIITSYFLSDHYIVTMVLHLEHRHKFCLPKYAAKSVRLLCKSVSHLAMSLPWILYGDTVPSYPYPTLVHKSFIHPVLAFPPLQ